MQGMQSGGMETRIASRIYPMAPFHGDGPWWNRCRCLEDDLRELRTTGIGMEFSQWERSGKWRNVEAFLRNRLSVTGRQMGHRACVGNRCAAMPANGAMWEYTALTTFTCKDAAVQTPAIHARHG